MSNYALRVSNDEPLNIDLKPIETKHAEMRTYNTKTRYLYQQNQGSPRKEKSPQKILKPRVSPRAKKPVADPPKPKAQK